MILNGRSLVPVYDMPVDSAVFAVIKAEGVGERINAICIRPLTEPFSRWHGVTMPQPDKQPQDIS